MGYSYDYRTAALKLGAREPKLLRLLSELTHLPGVGLAMVFDARAREAGYRYTVKIDLEVDDWQSYEAGNRQLNVITDFKADPERTARKAERIIERSGGNVWDVEVPEKDEGPSSPPFWPKPHYKDSAIYTKFDMNQKAAEENS